MTETNREIKFDRPKIFKYVKNLGGGGTGETNLLLDEQTGMHFAFKKFKPIEENDKVECYQRFVDEINILMKIYHPNIVRIFNYYLYPELIQIGRAHV